MNKEFDYKAMRYIAVVIPALLLIMGLKYGLIYLFVNPNQGTLDFTLFLNSQGYMLVIYFMECMLTIGMFVNLFRLSDVTSGWNAASIVLMISLITEVLLRILEWQGRYLELNVLDVSFVVFLSLIPEILRLLGIVLFLREVRRLKRKMRDGAVRRKPAKETEEKKSRGLAYSRHWFLAAVIMILSVPVTLFLCNFVYLFSLGVLKWIGLFVSVVYLSFSVLLGIQIRSFCQEYYLYRYNQG